jgi:hypothetical protein
MSNFHPPLSTGDYVSVANADVPPWVVVDKQTGKVITFANTRYYAREFADHTKGERIAKVHSVTYEVAH